MQPMERPGVRRETAGPVTTIILDRPARRNAVDPPTAAALRAAFRAFERDREARVAVLWGAHGTFCAGYDLKAFAAAPPKYPRPYGEGPMGPTRMRLAKPVIAAVSGYAVAGGLELALWCDLRVVEEDAIMGIFNCRWGLPLIDGGTVRLPAVRGRRRGPRGRHALRGGRRPPRPVRLGDPTWPPKTSNARRVPSGSPCRGGRRAPRGVRRRPRPRASSRRAP